MLLLSEGMSSSCRHRRCHLQTDKQTDKQASSYTDSELVKDLKQNETQSARAESTHKGVNRRSSEIQGTALGKCLQAWPVYIQVHACG